MAATRNQRAAADDEGGGTDTQTSGFTEEQRGELQQIISEALGGLKPPPAAAAKPEAPKVTDQEWDRMSDRQREGWVRSLVDSILDDLRREDEMAAQRADIDALKADKTPEKEGTPEPSSPLDKLRRILWGEQK